VLQKLDEQERDGAGSAIYVGSTPVDRWLPGFRAQNDITLPVPDALASFWLGNRTRVSAHFDFPDNVACVVAGRRRFTLFPPDQVGNLYVGPLDRTPSGQAISLVDFSKPDLDRYPRFAQSARGGAGGGDGARRRAVRAEHVVAPRRVAVAVQPDGELLVVHVAAGDGRADHGADARHPRVRDLPPRQREAWRTLFDHYVFDADESVYAHIPEPGRGCLAPLDDTAARKPARGAAEPAEPLRHRQDTLEQGCAEQENPQDRHRRRRHRGMDGRGVAVEAAGQDARHHPGRVRRSAPSASARPRSRRC
jgi:hypothetical protein